METTYTTKKEADTFASTMNKRYCADVGADDIFTFKINPLQVYDLYMDRDYAIQVANYIDTASGNITRMINSSNYQYDDQELDVLYKKRARLDSAYNDLLNVIMIWNGETI